MGPTRLIVQVEPSQPTSVLYPSKARAIVVSVEKGAKITEGTETIIVSYESLYTKPLFHGGRLLVEGALYHVKGLKNRYEVLVGVVEHRGFIVTLES